MTERTTTWAPLDLGPILDGGQLNESPTMLMRSDGVPLLYRAKVHTVQGEPEAGKGWLAALALTERLCAGEHVVYFDFEDAPETLVERLLALGVDPVAIRDRLHYVKPDEPLTEQGWADLRGVLAPGPTLAVIDGITEALDLHGLEVASNEDQAKWLRRLPRPLAEAGTTVLQNDHVVKDKERQGRYALGAQHKLGGVAAAYKIETVVPFGRGREGRSKLIVAKDRYGHVRRHQDVGERIAELHMRPKEGENVSLELRPPHDSRETFRPTGQMERASLAIEETPGLTKTAIRNALPGKNESKDMALDLLISDGYVERRQEGQAHQHFSLKPYREAGDEEASRSATVPPCPNPAPTVPRAGTNATVPPCPAPTRGRGTGHGHGVTDETPTVPLSKPTGNGLELPLGTDDELTEAERLRVKAQGWGEADRSVNGADALVGVKGVLSMGIRGLKYRQQLKRLRDASQFPEPNAEPESGPLWSRQGVEEWARMEGRWPA